MRVYIPTTILNIGNLLATDSISPSAFYKIREFGNSDWIKLNENGIDNAILLYEKPFFFQRPKSNLEDRPMWVSTEVDDTLPKYQDGIWYADHTLYFDYTTKFIFFSGEDDVRVAMSLAMIGESTKMLPLYQKYRMEYISDIDRQPMLLTEKKEVEFNNEEVKKDFRLNKMKGLLYGYYVGALLSSTPQEVGFLTGMRTLYAKLSSSFASFAPFKRETKEMKEIIIGEMQYEIESFMDTMKRHQNPLPISNKEVSVRDGRVVAFRNSNIEDGVTHELLISWLNDDFCKSKWGHCVNAMKSELADELTDRAVSIYKETWGTSTTRRFLNALRHHLAGETFGEEWHNDVLSSLAAFLLRGDDWEDMLLFMQDKGMCDYRLAFAFYGIFVGFASFPKSLSDKLFAQEKSYVAEYYGEVYKQMFGKGIPFPQKEPTQPINKELQNWKKEIMDFVRTSGILKHPKQKSMQEALEKTLANNGDNMSYEIFLESLSKYKDEGWGKGTNAWKALRDRFAPDFKQKKKKKDKNIIQTKSLFENNGDC